MAGRDPLHRPTGQQSSTRITRYASRITHHASRITHHASPPPLPFPAINYPPSTLNSPLASPDSVGRVGRGLGRLPGDQPDGAGCLAITRQARFAGFPAGLYGFSRAGAAVVRVD